MKTIIATDLDGTVLFSERAMAVAGGRPTGADLVSVDVDTETGNTYAYMTATAARRWHDLATAGVIVPSTTRSVPQYLRLRLPGPPPAYAVVCNGARVLVNGESDPSWERTVRRHVATAAPFATLWKQATVWRGEHDFTAVRAVEDFFIYLTVRQRASWLVDFAQAAHVWAETHGWRVSLQGRKLYLLPVSLDKAIAVAEVARRLGADRIVAGGDSLLDAEMLRAADAAIRPAHGELHQVGFVEDSCRTTEAAGLSAGDEILSWYGEQVGAFGQEVRLDPVGSTLTGYSPTEGDR